MIRHAVMLMIVLAVSCTCLQPFAFAKDGCRRAFRCAREVPNACLPCVVTCCPPTLVECRQTCAVYSLAPACFGTGQQNASHGNDGTDKSAGRKGIEPRDGVGESQSPNDEESDEPNLPDELRPLQGLPKEFAELLGVAPVLPSREGSARTWAHIDGRTCVATYVDSSLTHVRIKKGGHVYEVAVTKLSQIDRQFVAVQFFSTLHASR